MKIVRFSQNGHAPRLGCYLGQDRIADLEASECVSPAHVAEALRYRPR